jgi:hypothetical protein
MGFQSAYVPRVIGNLQMLMLFTGINIPPFIRMALSQRGSNDCRE